VISNAAAMVTAAIAFHTTAWWFDPIGTCCALVCLAYAVKNVSELPEQFFDAFRGASCR
jgi:hypothetical protein